MTEPIFDRPLSVELLQWLARASLRQPDILSMAIRLWGMLRSLYGGTGDGLYVQALGDRFGYPQWRDGFFLDAKTHHRGDAIPQLHHHDCPCGKTITDWLFDPHSGMTRSQWQADFDRHYSLCAAGHHRLLNPTAWVYDPACGQTEAQWRKSLQKRYKLTRPELDKFARTVRHPQRERHKNRPFAVSRKSLKKDLNTLVELGWLTVDTENNPDSKGEKYRKVDRFPTLAVSGRQSIDIRETTGLTGEFVQSDLVEFFENFAQPINNVQRFFLHVEYIIPSQLYGRVNRLQTKLKHLWSQTPVPPIRLVYRSAKQYQEEFECRVYPVCICYYQRAPYLFAYGETPRPNSPEESTIGWYDYRLDRIQSLEGISWQDENIPIALKPFKTTPKQPDEVFECMNKAMGFEFYQPYQEMLVWFDPYFYGNYIEGTERASAFKKLSHRQAVKWATTAARNEERSQKEKQALQALLKSRSASDFYYLIKYRVRDNNVIMRLRAWGGNVEVLYPLELRERMRSDLEKLWKRYSE